MYDNKVKIEFESKSQNEGFARVAISAFISQLDPTIEGKKDGIIQVEAIIEDNNVIITIIDFGKGIEDVKKAVEPLYTSKPELERSGMGFTVMETFMDSMKVESVEGKGTKVILSKKFNSVR